MKTQDQVGRSVGSLAKMPSIEREVLVFSGWLMLAVNLALLTLGIFLFVRSLYEFNALQRAFPVVQFVASILMFALAVVFLRGHFTLQPNQARVLILFGDYHGTVRESGFHWGNPFYTNGPSSLRAIVEAGQTGDKAAVAAVSNAMKKHSRNKISLRARNLNGEKLKVNDKRGNPIEIGAVVVWRVQDTAQAMFDVDDYESYVSIQSESALRHPRIRPTGCRPSR